MTASTRFPGQLARMSAAAIVLAAACGLAPAATPPALINYQGVLRDPATGLPMSGAYDAVFRFYNADAGGDEILVDTHAVMANQGLSVANGLFSVWLGGGVITDGSGAGNYLNLADLFRDYSPVFMQIEVQGQVLQPRVMVISSPSALNATNLDGKPRDWFLNTGEAFQFKNGPVMFDATSQPNWFAVQAAGAGGGLVAYDSDGGSGFTEAGTGDYGIKAYGKLGSGTGMAGWFKETTGSGEAWLAPGNSGLKAFGSDSGGVFRRGTPSSWNDEAALAIEGIGVMASGEAAGGVFSTTYGSGVARLAEGNTGVFGLGIDSGGTFRRRDLSGGWWDLAKLAAEGYGIVAAGEYAGGRFYKLGTTGGSATLANGWGIDASGRYQLGFGGGRFSDEYYSGMAQLGRADAGIVAHGAAIPGIFRRGSETMWDTWTHLAEGTASINGNGAKNFVQNHPFDPDAEIVYTALEGDEVGTYTRGSAVLENGIARVKLNPSFAWVTNPDIGLTATVTPRGVPVAVAVESVTTSELVVRVEAGARDVAFDYVVQGLRAGFERASVVRPRRGDAPIPSMAEHAQVYAAHPQLRQHNALERFVAMDGATRGGAPLDLSRSEALVAAIGIGDMNKPPVRRRSLLTPEHAAQWERDHPGESLAEFEARPSASPSSREGAGELGPGGQPPRIGEDVVTSHGPPAPPALPRSDPSPAASRLPEDASARGRLVVSLPAEGTIESSDLVSAEGRSDGAVRAAAQPADRAVAGIVLGRRPDGTVDVIVAGVAMLRVDAGYGPIATGDLLAASATPGHAMRSPDAAPGTVVAKALEPLESGTGVIRVIVMQR